MSIDSVMPSNHLIYVTPLPPTTFSCLQSFPSSGSFPISQLLASGSQSLLEPLLQLLFQSFQWYSGLIFFRIDEFDLLAVQGNLKSLLQYHNRKVSILQCLTFLMVQISHPYTTTGKTIALTIWALERITFLNWRMALVQWLNMGIGRRGGCVKRFVYLS